MRLSEAIRLGSLLSRQGIGGTMEGPTRCALAAACEASGIAAVGITVGPSINYHGLQERWPELLGLLSHPVYGDGTWTLTEAIYSLNDSCEWTREAIADWVETVEPHEPQAVEASPEVGAVREEFPSPVVSLRA